METFDFSGFIAPEIQNKRRENALPPKVQEFDNLKYRRAETEKGGKPKTVQGSFHISKKLFTVLGLASVALRHFVNPKDKNLVVIGTVLNDDGKFMKKRENKEKGDTFKSDSLEAALAEAGLIDVAKVGENQFLDLVEVGQNIEIAGIKTIKLYKVVKGAKKAEEKEAKVETAETSTASAPEVKAAPTPTPTVAATESAAPVAEPATVAAPAAAAAADDWS
jgi:hypothetical protein